MQEIDKDFGNWLAGFIDGEGCFGLYKRNDSAGWVHRFFLKLRDDDKEILYECQRRFGGTVRLIPEDNPKWGNQAVWTINSKTECFQLIELLTICPLRAKKKKEFEVWSKAVLLMQGASMHLGNNETKEANQPIWDEISSLKIELTELRKYNK